MSVERLGRYLEVDDRGHLSKLANPSLLQDDWREVVEAVREAYQVRWGKALHSIYLRGSLARGDAIAGVSDVDTLAVLMPNAAPPTGATVGSWSEQAAAAIGETFPFVAGVELDLIPFEVALDRGSPYSFILRVEAICLAGSDISERIEPFAPDHEAAFQTRYFCAHMDVFRKEYTHETPAEQKATLVWLMRRFVRLGMELVMEREKRYTRDLYPCFESFARHFPAKREEMWRALELALTPVVGDDAWNFAIDFGSWLEEQARLKVDQRGETTAPAG